MEKLIIQGFAGLQDIEIIPKKINLLIGPQASGKSIITKLLFYFRSFIKEIFVSGAKLESKAGLDKRFKHLFEQYFPPESWGEPRFSVRYILNDEYIEINRKSTKKQSISDLELTYSDLYKKILNQARSMVKKSAESIFLPKISRTSIIDSGVYLQTENEFLKKISEQLNLESAFDQLFIPAGRSLFAIYDENIFGFLSSDLPLDPLLIGFGRYYERARNVVNSHAYHLIQHQNSDTSSSNFSRLKSQLLVGEYTRYQGKDCIQSSDGRKVRLSYSSSGQQEILPLILILENLTSSIFNLDRIGTSTYIEEPEAHLFPSAQRDIVNLIVTAYNAKFNQFRFFLTTHSPYILTSFNNLIQAGILSKSGHRDQVLKVIPASQILDPDDVAAYHIVDGKARNIIDPETQLIDAQIIDSISEELAIQFDQLLEIE